MCFFLLRVSLILRKVELGPPILSPRAAVDNLLLMDKPATLYMSCFVQTTDTPPRKAGPNVCGACGRVGSPRAKICVKTVIFFSRRQSKLHIRCFAHISFSLALYKNRSVYKARVPGETVSGFLIVFRRH